MSNNPWLDPVNAGQVTEVFFKNYDYVGYWLMDECRRDKTINSKLLLFLPQNFAVNVNLTPLNSYYDYLMMLKYYSRKSIKELAFKMVRSRAMLKYLNGNSNVKDNPNENFAREF